MDAVKASLKRLKLDHIDLYQIHGNDPITPVEETVLAALDDLVKGGDRALCWLLQLDRMEAHEGGGHCRAQGSGAV